MNKKEEKNNSDDEEKNQDEGSSDKDKIKSISDIYKLYDYIPDEPLVDRSSSGRIKSYSNRIYDDHKFGDWSELSETENALTEELFNKVNVLDKRIDKSNKKINNKVKEIDEINKELEEEKKEMENKVKEMKDIVKETKKELEDLEKKMESKIEDSKIKVVQALGIFVALFTFVSVDFVILSNIQDLKQAWLLISLIGGFLLLFVVLIDYVIRAYKSDLFSVFYDDSKKDIEPFKKHNKVFCVISIVLICISGIGLFLYNPQTNSFQNKNETSINSPAINFETTNINTSSTNKKQ